MAHKLNNLTIFPLSVILLTIFANVALAEPAPVVVKTYGQHIGGNIVYQHQVTNNGTRNVVEISIALDTDQLSPNFPYSKAQGQLNVVMPVGLESLDEGINPASVSGPTGWKPEVIQIEDSGRYLQWSRPRLPLLPLQPGQTLRFTVTVPEYFEAYLTGHFSAGYGDGNEPWYYNGVMEKLDVTPPTLTVTLTPSTLPPNGKHVPITATITAKDDYDPSPEIKLESITPSEMTEPGDIRDAHLGTDDRQFMLKAESRGKNKTARFYTVIYSATDASGNKATASATVTVSHDDRGHDEHGNDDHRDDKDKKDKDDHKRDR
jgi:hypothetical protein